MLIVYPAGIVDSAAIDEIEIPAAREGHVTLRSEVEDGVLGVNRLGAQA